MIMSNDDGSDGSNSDECDGDSDSGNMMVVI